MADKNYQPVPDLDQYLSTAPLKEKQDGYCEGTLIGRLGMKYTNCGVKIESGHWCDKCWQLLEDREHNAEMLNDED